jgi:hypothetical protein
LPVQDEQKTGKDEDLLRKIRQRYRYGMDKWRRNREEGQKNMRYVAGDPWDDEDKKVRAGRPTVCPDELNQYVNQVVNTARQNPRGIKVDPAGNDATAELAEYRENRIRAIEYACNASQVYINGLQAAVERNVGYWKVSRRYVDDDSDEQEIVILPIPNPDSVLIDPDFKEMNGSDIRWAFELDRMPIEDFEEEYPNAEKTSFTSEDFGDDSSFWYDENTILVASYWEVTTTRTKGKTDREIGKRTVKQYVTNGCEILKRGADQPGPYIPIVPVFGKQLWVDYTSNNAERVLVSLVSLARDPQKALAFVMSAMLENLGQLPRVSYIGAVGQFETDKAAWDTSNVEYHPYLQFDMLTDESGTPVPAPARQQLAPDFQSYSIGTDICRRAIQSAMGIGVQTTATQRANQKSGTALEKIQSEQAIGSYHLVDAYDGGIELTGRIVNNWLSEVDLGQTQKPVRLADGKHQLVPINTDGPVMVDDHQYNFPIADDKGRYQVTISAGPSHESQREEGSEFVDSLLQNSKDLPPPGSPQAKILAIGIKLKQLGPLGDQMADIFDPPNQGGQQQQMAQMQQQFAAMKQQMDEQSGLVQKLMLERQGKVIETQGRLGITRMQETTKLAVAQINASKDAHEGIADAENETYQLFHDNAHDLAMQSHQQAHERDMSDRQAAQAQQQQQAGAQATSQQSAQDAAQAQQATAAAPPEGQ